MPHESIRALVWLDCDQAKIFFVKEQDLQAGRLDVRSPKRQLHHDAQASDDDKVRDDRKFFEAILAVLENVEAWMLAGPGRTKHDLEKYLDGHAEDLRGKLIAVEEMEQLTDSALAQTARQLFKAHTRMAPTDRGGERTVRGVQR